MKNFFCLLTLIAVQIFCFSAFALEKRFGAPLQEGSGLIVEGQVTDVCKKKGCFLKLKTDSGEERFVRFKNYGFFVPQEILGKRVKIKAETVTKEVSVKEQKHLLEDAKADQSKIDAIVTPVKRKEWVASGVEVVQTPQ